MGAEPWDYFVPYEADVAKALQKLREREFQAGRFRGSDLEPETIDEAIENMDADGTGSILDMFRISPTPDYFAVCPLSPSQLLSYFGTDKPTRDLIEENSDFFEDIERGQGVYIIVYDEDEPNEIYFAGYSFD